MSGETELQRIAYHLWVLAKKPEGGPEQFLDEAKNIIEKRGLHRLDALQKALEEHENGGPSTPSPHDPDAPKK